MLLSNIQYLLLLFVFFFNDTATTEIYTLSLHDALPIYADLEAERSLIYSTQTTEGSAHPRSMAEGERSEEHTSELQSQSNLVCRLLLEKKKILQVMTVVLRMRHDDVERSEHCLIHRCAD